MPTYAVRAPLARWLAAEAARAGADLGPYRLLDVGCGEMPYLALFEPHAREVVGLGWLCVVAGVWTGIGLVAGLPLEALTWIALGLVTVRD